MVAELSRLLTTLLLVAPISVQAAPALNGPPGRGFFDGGPALHFEISEALVRFLELAPPAPIDGTEVLSGRALLDKVASLAAQGHRAHTYDDASDHLFSTVDNVVVNGVRGVVDAYSDVFVPGTSKNGVDYPENGDRNGDGWVDKDGMNVEHTWPQSLFKRALPMRSDLHQLRASFQHPNSIRGSFPFGVVAGRPEYKNAAGAKCGGGVFEPPDAAKGRVARGLLYFYTRYKSSRFLGRTSAVFWNRQIDVLLRWNREHLPDAYEAERNNLVASYQGNRNPFIDDPGLADRIGAEALRADLPSRGRLPTARRRPGVGMGL